MTAISTTDVNLSRIARELELRIEQITGAVELLDAGNTVPFITRYRKDQTGGLDESQIERIRDRVTAMRLLAQRKQTILRSIESQGKLTDELRRQIERADHVRRLEDLYLPSKPKKQTLATKAIEQGLEPLAREIFEADKAVDDLDARAADFVNEDKGVATPAEALLGAGHIVAEKYSEQADLRQRARKIFRTSGKLTSTQVKDDHKRNAQFRDYHAFSELLSRVPPHRVMAINRGEKAGVLRVRIETDTEAIHRVAGELLVPDDHPHKDFLSGCVRDSIDRLVLPSLEREARRELSDKAETHAVEVFARNLRKLLLAPPLPGRRVLAMDPGFKSGCKLAALDEYGKPLAHAIVHIIGKEDRIAKAKEKIVELIRTHQLNTIAIGNGTACRETEQLVGTLLAGELSETDLAYVIVNEAGASVYSTSSLGREELFDCDAMQRSAISIGRRLQDPLSELVKIDPANIGVGQYQHDAKPRHLRDKLDDVVRSCVSFVGVDVNTASPALLRYVSGLNQLTARRLFEFRQEHGPFKIREQLREISGLGEATFTQAAGFLKIDGGDEPLDATWIHPESYAAAGKLLTRLEIEPARLRDKAVSDSIAAKTARLDMTILSGELELGELALADMIEALIRPGRDPREDLPPPIFRHDVLKLDDLEAGMELFGTVLNVVDFGAFVDVGLPDSGLVHISQLASGYVRDPHDVVAVGDHVRIWVSAIDKERRRVALTMIEPGTERPPEPRPKRHGRRDRPKRDGQRRTGGRKPQSGDRHRHHAKQRPPRKKKPVIPITEAMADGKEPMRTFGDLIQFYEKKHGEDEEKKDEST